MLKTITNSNRKEVNKLDEQDFSRIYEQLLKTQKALVQSKQANLVAHQSIKNLEYQLKLIEQKLNDMEERDKKLDG
jgi:hypothetical protein